MAGTYASLTLNADGSYSYVTNGTSLPSGGAAQDIFSYTATDGHGSTTTTTLRQGRVAIDPFAALVASTRELPSRRLSSATRDRIIEDAGPAFGSHAKPSGRVSLTPNLP